MLPASTGQPFEDAVRPFGSVARKPYALEDHLHALGMHAIRTSLACAPWIFSMQMHLRQQHTGAVHT